MRKKLRLNADELAVESFRPGGEGAGLRGTVRGRDQANGIPPTESSCDAYECGCIPTAQTCDQQICGGGSQQVGAVC
ncbi:MAG TPA: hypothetical protein VHG08_02660 [Longimicrobium sp.]|nr:hypothetical protein [Longimicrobium sp.]